MVLTFAAGGKGETMTDGNLIKALRCCSNTANIEKTLDPCAVCPVPKEKRSGEYPNWCDMHIMRLAAERLEELTK